MHAHTHTHAHMYAPCTHIQTHTHAQKHCPFEDLLHSHQWWSVPRVLVQNCQFQGFSLLLCCASGAGDVFQWRGFTSGAAFRGEGCHTRLVGALCGLHLLFQKQHQSQIHTYTCIIAACTLMPTCACRQTPTQTPLPYTHTHTLLTF